ncbi:M48 family metallopeptidase [Pelagibacteraceae bacterium]|nr:M48 family metallopeptidase [Pelagibacteraceae bacterium]
MKKTNHQIKYILHKDVSITVKIKKYKYSRNYKVTYDKKNLQALVSIPNYITYNNGYKFALENIDWIYDQHIEMFPSILIDKGNKINIFGLNKTIKFKTDKANKVEFKNNDIIISSFEKNRHSSVFYNWIKSEIIDLTKKILIEKFKDINIKKIRISNSFNYWGSCNTKDSISIDWRLIFAPKYVIEYIIIHELCHLTVFNHSSKFWKLVDTKISNRKKSQNWLRLNANYLYRIRFS